MPDSIAKSGQTASSPGRVLGNLDLQGLDAVEPPLFAQAMDEGERNLGGIELAVDVDQVVSMVRRERR